MADKLHEFEMEIFASGKWNGDTYTDKDLDSMVGAFDILKDELKPPLKLGHNDAQLKEIMKDGQPALGWVTKLKKAGSKLIATVTQVPDLVYKAIKAGRYKRVSSEIYWNYKKDGSNYSKVLAGVALLGADLPAVSSLADLEAYLTQSMQDASFERVALYSFDADEAGQISSTEQENTTQGDNITMDEQKEYTEKMTALEAANKELTEKLATYEQIESEHRTYKEELDAIRKARADEKMESKKKIFADLCNKMVEEGKMPPAVRDTLCDFDKHNYSDEGGFLIPLDILAEAFTTLSAILDTTEKGIEKKTAETANVHAEVDARARAIVSEKIISYSDAVSAVLRDDPELAEQYLSTTNKA